VALVRDPARESSLVLSACCWDLTNVVSACRHRRVNTPPLPFYYPVLISWLQSQGLREGDNQVTKGVYTAKKLCSSRPCALVYTYIPWCAV
jgi:hypothetical protein